MTNLRLAFLLFWILGGVGLAVHPTFAKMTKDLSDHTLEEKRQTFLASDRDFKKIHIASNLKDLKALPEKPSQPLLPLIAKGPTSQTRYKGLPYGSSTTSSGNVKSKKAKMIVVNISPDGSPEGDNGDDGGGNDPDSDEEDEGNPYLRGKILKRKREARIQEIKISSAKH